jgi:flagellar basal body P-ring formation protein FlgA
MAMKSLVLLPLIALTALAPIASASAASVRSNVVVEGDQVRLGDIFEDAGPKADTVVLYAPAPGRKVTLNANWLAEVARIYKVAWRPLSQYDRAVVERAGNVISNGEIVGALRRELIAKGMPAHHEIELINRTVEITVPLDVLASVDVRNVSYNVATGQFNAVAVAGGDSSTSQRVMLQGRTHAASAIPVLRKAINPGEIIRKDDIEMVYRREDQIGRDIVADAAHLIGRTPLYRLRSGDPVRENDVRQPTLVKRNSQVLIRLEWGAMTLTAQGKALDEGSRGDMIRVENLQSNKTIEATVTGPDLVIVTLGPRPQLSANQ